MALKTDPLESLFDLLLGKALPDRLGEVKILETPVDTFFKSFPLLKHLPITYIDVDSENFMDIGKFSIYETEKLMAYLREGSKPFELGVFAEVRQKMGESMYDKQVSASLQNLLHTFINFVYGDSVMKNYQYQNIAKLHSSVFQNASEYYNSVNVVDYRQVLSGSYKNEALQEALSRDDVMVITTHKVKHDISDGNYTDLDTLLGKREVVGDVFIKHGAIKANNPYEPIDSPTDLSYKVVESENSDCYFEGNSYYYAVSQSVKDRESGAVLFSEEPIKVGLGEVIKLNFSHEDENATFRIYRSEANPTAPISDFCLYHLMDVTKEDLVNGFDCDDAGFFCDRNRIEAGNQYAWVIPKNNEILEFVTFSKAFVIENYAIKNLSMGDLLPSMLCGVFFALAMHQPDKIFKIINI